MSKPVAWVVDRAMSESRIEQRKPKKSECLSATPLYLHPDPRVAELEATCADHGEIQKDLCERVAELEAVLRECREAFIKNIIGSGGRTQAMHESILKIDEVLNGKE